MGNPIAIIFMVIFIEWYYLTGIYLLVVAIPNYN